MKLPKTPPSLEAVARQLMESGIDRLWDVTGRLGKLVPEAEYLHWDKLRHLSPPEGLSHQEWWYLTKLRRRNLYKELPLRDKTGTPFRYLTVDPVPEILHEIDQNAGGTVQMQEQITNPQTRDQYYVRSLVQEAITSSQLEGAATTRKVAKEMIRAGRSPRDRSEQMILNNYLTMREIGRLKTEALSKELVFRIHDLITRKTLDDASAVGRFRRADECIVVGDMYNEVFHEPPAAEQLEDRMAAMCDFANGLTPTGFVHPAIRAIILHFWLAYDHPFVDGNGRAARALFYWSMRRSGFWLFEFISISQILLDAPAQYGRAFLYTETDENDLTYFIIYHLEVIRRAIKELHQYLQRKTKALQALEHRLRALVGFNHRQRALIVHALHHPDMRYTIQSHRMSHNVVYQTARVDLLDLCRKGLFESRKIGKSWYFTPIKDIEAKLSELS